MLPYRKHKYDKTFCGKTLEQAKEKAREWLSLVEDEFTNKEYFQVVKAPDNFNGKKTRFSAFAQSYMENVKKPRVKPETYYSYRKTFQRYIFKPFGKFCIGEITPIIIQKHLNRINERTPRACEDVKCLLNNIFSYAVDNALIDRNPIKAVYIPKHERTTGTALTLEEENAFIKTITGHKLELIFLLALYTGARRCELASANINVEENTITFRNGKLKRYQKNLFRTIPIFPKLQPYVTRLISENWQIYVTEHQLSIFSQLVPGHTLKDLRHTFTSRAKECKIADEIVSMWTGHSLGSLTARVYTHYSPEFMQAETKRLVY